MNLEITNIASSGISYAKYYSGNEINGANPTITLYYNAGKNGIDYRFLEYNLSYSLSEDEDTSILSYIREQDLSGKSFSEIEFLNDSILPGGSALCPVYDGSNNIVRNTINFFGSFVVGLKTMYVFHVPELVWKIELFEKLTSTEPFITINLSGSILEWEYEKYVFLSSTQESSQATSNVKISYEAWKKLINPIRNKKKRNLQNIKEDISQITEPSDSIYFDGASGTLLGTKKVDSPILDGMKSTSIGGFSRWKKYKKGDFIYSNNAVYISLVDNNIGEWSPSLSTKWARQDSLCNLTRTVTILCNHGIFEFGDTPQNDSIVLNIFGNEVNKAFKLRLPDGVSIDLGALENDSNSIELSYLTKLNSVEMIAETGERYNEVVIYSKEDSGQGTYMTDEVIEVPLESTNGTNISIKIKDPQGDYIEFNGSLEKTYTVNFVDSGRIKDYVEIDFSSDLDISNHGDRDTWVFEADTNISGITVDGNTLRITPEAMIALSDNTIILKSTLHKIQVLIANSGDYYIPNPFREVGYGEDAVFNVYPTIPGDDIEKVWINKTMIDGEPKIIEVSTGLIPESEYTGYANQIWIVDHVSYYSIEINGIHNELRIDIVKEDEN